jgi:4-amino-4-deoxy-L-arabinose transferase-like glycosyltransferase
MDLKLQRLNSGEKIAGGSALALFVCMFFGWFNFGFEAVNAWEALHYISPILAIAIVATVGIAFMKASEKSLGDIPEGSVIFALGCLATFLVLYRLIDPVSSPGVEGYQTSGSVEAGLFLSLLAAGGIAVGGYMATGGTALDQVKALFPNAGASAITPQAVPPPPQPAQPAPPPPQPAQSTLPVEPVPATPTPDAAGSTFCEECGATLTPEDRFCSECGKEQTVSPG